MVDMTLTAENLMFLRPQKCPGTKKAPGRVRRKLLNWWRAMWRITRKEKPVNNKRDAGVEVNLDRLAHDMGNDPYAGNTPGYDRPGVDYPRPVKRLLPVVEKPPVSLLEQVEPSVVRKRVALEALENNLEDVALAMHKLTWEQMAGISQFVAKNLGNKVDVHSVAECLNNWKNSHLGIPPNGKFVIPEDMKGIDPFEPGNEPAGHEF